MNTFNRVLCIIHLCLGFSLFLWFLLYPFLGQVYHYKSQMGLFESVFKQKELFHTLTARDREHLEKKFDKLKALSSVSQVHEAIDTLLSFSPYTYAWLILSLILPIFLLLKIDGATQAAWLLPIVCVFMFLQSRGHIEKTPSFYPSELYILDTYVDEPKADTTSGQFAQLKRGWELYLITEFAKEQPSNNSSAYSEQKERGEFYFNIARLKASPAVSFVQSQNKKPNPLLLALLLAWESFFVFFMHTSARPRIRITDN